jgi:hypothetical protein
VWCYRPNNTTSSLYPEKGGKSRAFFAGIALFLSLNLLFLGLLNQVKIPTIEFEPAFPGDKANPRLQIAWPDPVYFTFIAISA